MHVTGVGAIQYVEPNQLGIAKQTARSGAAQGEAAVQPLT